MASAKSYQQIYLSKHNDNADFIDYMKAIDRVIHEDIVQIPETLNTDGKDIIIIKNIYWNKRVAITVNNDIGH